MKIAVVGSGISGLSAAYYLSKKHKVDLFEKDDHFGGHSYTLDLNLNDKKTEIPAILAHVGDTTLSTSLEKDGYKISTIEHLLSALAGTGVDTPHLDRFEPHLVFLYYVCDSDGDTIIYDYKTEKEGDVPFFEDVKELKRITPKQGRVVIFDGMYWHTAEQPTKDVRCVINFNISTNGT